MTAPVWLIAGREFRAYAATASFWVALAVGPLVLSGAMLMTGGRAPPSTAALTLTRADHGVVEARFSEDFPLSAVGRDQVLRVVEREGRLGGALRRADAAAKRSIDPAAVSRFMLVMMLWVTLTGSLGMLLQAVVRERSNRALESLLAAASAWEVVCGKLIGVGGVSLLVLAGWLGFSALASGLSPVSGGLVVALVHGLAQPALLARAGVIYLLAYALYGFATVAVGGLARDNADAQNLARPMFAVLLGVFFAALASVGGHAQDLAWLVYLPPFTPFMLLIEPRTAGVEWVALALLGVATAGAGMLAVRALGLNPMSLRPGALTFSQGEKDIRHSES